MLRQLKLPPDTDPADVVITAGVLSRMQQAVDVIHQAEVRAAELARAASAEAAQLKTLALRQGYHDGFAQALQAVVPVLGDLLAERSRWMDSVSSAVLTQLAAEFSRLEFSQAQIEKWCNLQMEHGAQRLAVYLPRDQDELLQALQQPLAGVAHLELADVPAPVVTADDLVFVLEPGSNLPVVAVSESLSADIQAFAEYQAGRYERLATRPIVAASTASQEPRA